MKRGGFSRSSLKRSGALQQGIGRKKDKAETTKAGKAATPAAKKALRRISRLRARAGEEGALTTEWETEFLDEVQQRIDKYGRAFGDPEKGNLDMPLSFKQARKLIEIQRSVARKEGGGGQRRG